MFVLLPHVGGLTGRRLLVFCSMVPFSVVWFWWRSLTDSRGGKGERGCFFLSNSVWEFVHVSSDPTPTLCPSQTLTPILLSPLTHINADPSSETERRKEFILPVPALSVKLIRLWAPDNSIIRDSFNNRNPPPPPPTQLQTLQSHNITTHYCISKFIHLTRTSRVNWHSAWRAKHLALPQTRWGVIFELSCTYTTFLFSLCSCFTSALV